jgi:hypothetical protein
LLGVERGGGRAGNLKGREGHMSGRRRRAGKVGCAAVLAVVAGVAIAGAAQAADKMQF